VNFKKSVEEFLPNKKARPDLNLSAFNLKFAQIVKTIRPTICKNDSIKMKAWPIKNAKA